MKWRLTQNRLWIVWETLKAAGVVPSPGSDDWNHWTMQISHRITLVKRGNVYSIEAKESTDD